MFVFFFFCFFSKQKNVHILSLQLDLPQRTLTSKVSYNGKKINMQNSAEFLTESGGFFIFIFVATQV